VDKPPKGEELQKLVDSDPQFLDRLDHSYMEMRAILSGKRAPHGKVSAKDTTLMAGLEGWLAGDEKAIIYSPFAETIARLIPQLKNCFPDYGFVKLTGSCARKDRDVALTKVREDPDTKAILMTDAGGAGVDGLQDVITRVICFDMPYTHGRLEQLVGRAYRRGQTRPVQRIYFITEDTFEEDMLPMLDHERRMAQAVRELAQVELSDKGREILETGRV
jgi:SNF2 family DNA or RNA helicase